MPQKHTLEDFIKLANEVHGNEYDYSKVEYVNNRTDVCIICPEHGDFLQRPDSHLRGRGCPICRYIKSSAKVRMSQEEFISRSTGVHNGKYDYSYVEYKNTDTKVKIICPEHGEFYQTPHHHLKGIGCPECGKKFGICEKRVLELIKENFENVIYQYIPEWLHTNRVPQSLDIYLPDYNIAIEYQGRQHFYPNVLFGGEEEFVLIQERDKRKYEKCVENGVKLFYISFEKKVPKDYFTPIYRTNEELLNAINNHIVEKHG